jgi:hypothetical protein
MASISHRRTGMSIGRPWSIVIAILYGFALLSLLEDIQRSPVQLSKKQNFNLRHRTNLSRGEPHNETRQIECEGQENNIVGVHASLKITQMLNPAQQQTKSSKFLNTCDSEDFDLLVFQLPKEHCNDSRLHPWSDRCSFSYATRCPDNSQWWTPTIHTEFVNSVFIGGQNSDFGMRAIQFLQLATGEEKYNIDHWRREALLGNAAYAQKCPLPSLFLNNTRVTVKRPRTTVHYFATNTETTTKLLQASKILNWDQFFKVKNFPYFTPDTLDRMFSMARKQPVDMLRIDGESNVYAILKSGKRQFLPKTRYLEFEYNWMAGWTKRKLSETIELLDREGFICYWAGTGGNLWRITDCWQDHYDGKFWSNVACVSRSHDDLVETMETMFQNTIRKGHSITYSNENTVGTDGSVSSWMKA